MMCDMYLVEYMKLVGISRCEQVVLSDKVLKCSYHLHYVTAVYLVVSLILYDICQVFQ